jgi:gliding motility-associated-like protein/uncharacterized repeat protein (TIGR01451 family)
MTNIKTGFLFIFLLINSIVTAQICEPGTAAYATGGKSAYKDQVLWLTWGGSVTGLQNQALPSGTKSNATFTLANQQMCFECEIGNINRISGTANLNSYKPGSWKDDSLDDLYNIGGVDSNNKLVNGIKYNEGTINFTLTCSAKLDGNPYKIRGLVMADAESLAKDNKEFLKASGKGEWQVVEMNKMTNDAYNISKINQVDNKQEISFLQGNNQGSAAVSFLSFNQNSYTSDSKVNIDFSIKGEGTTAIAIGLLVPNADGGDAPQSYGEVYHLIKDVNITSDGIPTNGTVVNANAPAFTPGKIIPPADLFLGSMGPDAERAMIFSDDALGDQKTGENPNEEDAWPLDKKVIYNILPGSVIAIDVPYVSTGTTTIAGWIDFNRNGVFDPSERAVTTFNGTGKSTARLSWTVPADFVKGKTFARLRISSVESDLVTATGIAADGEVEDHELYIDDPKFTISKTSNAVGNIWNIQDADKKYSISVKNIATVKSYGTVKVLDHLPLGITPNWQGTYQSNGWNLTYTGQDIIATTTNVIDSNQTITFDFPVKIDSQLISNNYINYASVGGGGDNDYPEPINPIQCAGSTAGSCTSYTVAVIRTIEAVNDAYGVVIPNQSLKSILENDLLNKNQILDPSKVSIKYDVNSDANKVLVAVDGSLIIKPDVAPGVYKFEYSICEVNAIPANCASAFVSFEVVAAPKTVGTTVYALPNTPVTSAVTITPGSGTITSVTIPVTPPDLVITINPNGTFTATPGFSYEGGAVIEVDYVVTDSNGFTTTSKITIIITEDPSLALVKKANLKQLVGTTSKTEEVEYTFEITNTGNVTLNNVSVSDKMLSTTPIVVTPSTLKPSEIGYASYTLPVTLAHYNAGGITNSATADGTSPKGTKVSDISGTSLTNDDPTIINLAQQPDITLVKTSIFNDENNNGFAELGETVTYTFITTNTGNVTVTNVNLSDSFLNISNREFSPSVLNPGESATMQIKYSITQQDIDLGLIVNTAEVEAYDPSGDLVFDISGTTQENDTPTETSLQSEPGISIVKTATFLDDNNDGTAQIGETIAYNFSIKNTGAVTLYDIVVSDNLPGLVLKGNTILKLEPGEVNTTNYTATYQITLEDLKNGEVKNQAQVSGKTIQGATIIDDSDGASYSGNTPTVTYVNGCSIEVFNALTPDGDGKNDFFYIQGIECYPNNTVEIYNRWGVLVFRASGYNNQDKAFKGYSDGRVTMNRNDMLPVGTYFYILNLTDFNNKTHKVQGYLYLNR